MTHGPAVRTRARELYISGDSLDAVSRATGVPLPTLKRWSRQQGWTKQRRLRARIELGAMELAAEMARAAAATRDPQQVYALAQAARVAGLERTGTPERMVSPAEIAEALLDALAAHPDVGPPLRRNRGEILRIVMRELERPVSRPGTAVSAVSASAHPATPA